MPKADHVPDDHAAIFNSDATSSYITMGDVMHLERYAEFAR